MKLHLNQDAELLLIRAYTADQITVGNTHYRTSIMVTPTRVITDWTQSTVADLAERDFRLMLEFGPEVVLLGTGHHMVFPPPSITHPLVNQSIGLEVMDTAAACRTYNILAGEGRNVLAALIIEPTPDG
ncbi:MAG: Mth938-like domain-containing protein [Arenicellales bacterium]|nr:Mth938-like domain-containing protein [Arenicellales bacterium]